MTGLVALEDQGDHGGKSGILGHAVTHAPAEQLGILALQQADEGALFGLAEAIELVLKEGHKDHIQLEHAATAGPLQAGLLTWVQHGTLLTKTGEW